MKVRSALFISLLFIFPAIAGECQTMFSLLKSDLKAADDHFQKRNFQSALSLYLNQSGKKPADKHLQLMIGRCYYNLKQYQAAVNAYEKSMATNADIPATDIYLLAEAQAGIGNYTSAIRYYREYLTKAPDDQLVIKKIWRLNNIKFLFEDSLHYAVRPIALNSSYGDMCAMPFREGLVFISNRKELQLVHKTDAALNAPFYKLYYAKIIPDTITRIGMIGYGKSVVFGKELHSVFHSGPVSFFDRSRKFVFAATSNKVNAIGARTLQLAFAEERDGVWKTTMTFPYNSVSYSISDPAISEDGKILYFSSDMKGGFGGKDLYSSVYENGQWTKPRNLGEQINTAYDEVFPYLHHNKILYFSSNGHAGLGGLDIFKVQFTDDGIDEVRNLGYPLNTRYDEFGIVVDSLNTHGYISSNRREGGYNDDIYEFDIDLQIYPLVINGVLKFKEHNWSDSSHLTTFPNAKLYLIDHIRNVTVHECASDGAGNFSMKIPYFSQYKIRVVGPDNDESIVSLEIPKHRKEQGDHEVVIVKDAYRSFENQVLK
jgi:tetratricopeptide (TPR) repeat protein